MYTKLRISAVTLLLFGSALMLLGLDCRIDPPTEPLYAATNNDPSWSHGGDRIVFFALIPPDSIAGPGLYIVDTTGENLRRLIFGNTFVAWLPGDTGVIVTGDDSRPYVLDLRTDSVSLLCDCVVGRFPELDPTAHYLYYEGAGVADGWATSIYQLDLSTGDTTHIVGGSFPAVSPDGDRLLYWRDDQVRCRDLVADSEWVVFEPGFQAQPDWSPDGSEVVIGNITRQGYYGKLYKVKPDGSAARYFGLGISPAYSPSGNRIAVARFADDGRSYIWLIDPDGGNPKRITF